MTGLFHSVVRFRLAIVVIATVIMVTAISQLIQMRVNVLPNFAPTTVEVQTEALGLSAQEVEAMITVPLEADMLNGIPWLEKIDSRSITGLSSIEMHFEPGTDLMVARQMVQERLTAAHALPNVSKPPLMRQPVATDARAAQFGLTSKEMSLIDLSVLARWTISPRLMGVPGVAHISIWGERARQMQILVRPEELASAGAKLEDVVRTSGNSMWVSPLSYLNASTPGTGGFIDTPNQRLGIQHVFPIVAVDDMKQLALTGESGKLLGDVATVVEGHQPLIGDALINGEQGLLMVVEKFPWASSEAVAAGIEEAMVGLTPGLAGVDVNMSIFSAGETAKATGYNLRLAAIAGAVLAIALVAFTTMNMQVSLMTAFSAGAAVLAASAIVLYLNVSVNTVLLGGLCLAAAMILHDAFSSATSAASHSEADGALDHFGATRTPLIFASVAALVAAVPLLFLSGINGVVAQTMTVPYMIAIAVSLATSLIIVPAIAGVIPAKAQFGGNTVTPMDARLARLLPLGGVTTPQIGGALLAAFAAVGLAIAFFVSPSTLPDFRTKDMVVEWLSPPGASIEAVRDQGKAASDLLIASDLIDSVAVQVGRAEISDEVLNANAGTLWVSLNDGVSPSRAQTEIEDLLSGIEGISPNITSYQNRQMVRSELNPSAEPYRVRVYGHEFDLLAEKSSEVAAAIGAIGGVNSAQVVSAVQEPVIEIEVDLDKARLFETKPGDVRRSVAAIMAGIQVGSLFENQKVFDVVVWGNSDVRSSLASLETVKIDTPKGQTLLSNLAEVRVANTPSFISRSSVSRFADIVVDGPKGLALEIETVLASLEYPLEYHAEVVGGTAIGDPAATVSVWQVGMASLIAVGLLMQASLGSWVGAALAVGHGLAVAGAAALVALLLGAWSAAAMVGAIAAFGIGIRDASAILSQTASTPDSSQVVIGNGAAIAALIPVLVFGGSTVQFVSMAVIALIGGLICSALLAVFILPSFIRDEAFEDVAAPIEEMAHA